MNAIRMIFARIPKNPWSSKRIHLPSQKNLKIATSINIESKDGEEIPVLVLLSEARLEDETTYTAFIQNISVDLF